MDKVNPIELKLRNNPIRVVMAKLSPIENVILSISSRVVCFGKRVFVKQYPGKKATRTKAKTYRM